MNDLPAKIRGMYHVSKTDLEFVRREALKLCDDYETLEAERNYLLDDAKNVYDIVSDTMGRSHPATTSLRESIVNSDPEWRPMAEKG